ncbi:unnamed protein product, partial [Prorocentrum cordatum]
VLISPRPKIDGWECAIRHGTRQVWTKFSNARAPVSDTLLGTVQHANKLMEKMIKAHDVPKDADEGASSDDLPEGKDKKSKGGKSGGKGKKKSKGGKSGGKGKKAKGGKAEGEKENKKESDDDDAPGNDKEIEKDEGPESVNENDKKDELSAEDPEIPGFRPGFDDTQLQTLEDFDDTAADDKAVEAAAAPDEPAAPAVNEGVAAAADE